MLGAFMARASVWTVAWLSAAAVSLAACEGMKGGEGATEGAPEVTRAQTSTRLVERDVEAPQVFQASDKALWDGRPSLGGVWVASPAAVDPERVIIRNPANGKFVIGALFRRERMNPGPTLQISSDAAAALGILAGQPVEVNVTALRREEVPEAGPAVAAAATGPILDAAETVETTTLTAAAGAAIDRAAAPPAATPAVAAARPVAPVMTAAAIAPASSATPAAAAAAATKPTAPATRGTGVIQIGIFSVEANATRAVTTLGKAGVEARSLREESQGKVFWRVVAPPAADRNATLTKVKSAGFGDAYFTAR